MRQRLCFLFLLVVWVGLRAQPTPPQLVALTSPILWQRAEFRVLNVPASTNPYDPGLIRVDATFTLPSGRQMTVPAFWYQGYQRRLSNGSEALTQVGSAEWRLRFAPSESGSYGVSLVVRTNGQVYSQGVASGFTVAAAAPVPGSGYVRVAPGGQYFETGDSHPLRLIGANVCWHGSRGTYDYDDWFTSMAAAGENYARLWMWPYAFGIETEAGSLTRYRQDHAWKLDYVVQLAEQRGIYLLPCFDYHGMFEITPDYWGGNNFWLGNPYSITNGGPCLNQNGFFTNATARVIYQKRLRYLVARYGYSPKVLAWQFFNEIDNVYAYLRPGDVAAWHGIMGAWLRANDPFGHLVTTSLTGGSDRPEMWQVPELDFACYHSYGETAPALRFSAVTQDFLRRYRKPVLIDEYGTDWRGWNRANDPWLRGFRQGLWGGALGGSVGTGMSWWWENLHSENAYPVYSALATVLKRTGWGRGTWTNAVFLTSGPPPNTVGPAAGDQAFSVTLVPSGGWGVKPPGQLAVPNTMAAAYAPSALNSFVHGTGHPDLRVPFRVSAWFTNNARLVAHLNSVSSGAILAVRANGVELFRTNLPNLDGGYQVNNEYNADLPVNLPAGKGLVEVVNTGGDWFYLDWVRLENVLPAEYASGWAPSPDAIGLRGSNESLLYLVAPGASFPANATNAVLPMQAAQTVTLTNVSSGLFLADWYDPASGLRLTNTQAMASNNSITLALPGFREDLAGIVYKPPVLEAPGVDGNGQFHFRLRSETGGRYDLERSTNLAHWERLLTVTNWDGVLPLSNGAPVADPPTSYRAKQVP